MSGENQKGFTIIETTLFLAVSALLFVTLLGGISLAVQRQRYSDSIQSTHSFLQKQFNETLNVVNGRDNDPCPPSNRTVGSSDCIAMGKAIQFYPNLANADEIAVFPVIGTDPDSGNNEVTIADYKPTIIDDNNTTKYLIAWGAKVVRAKRMPNTNINTILLLRSPDSGATFIYALNSPPQNTPLSSVLNSSQQVTESQEAVICLQSLDIANAFASFTFTGSGTQDGVEAKFDQGANCGLSA